VTPIARRALISTTCVVMGASIELHAAFRNWALASVALALAVAQVTLDVLEERRRAKAIDDAIEELQSLPAKLMEVLRR
jgi:hypothetical protein